MFCETGPVNIAAMQLGSGDLGDASLIWLCNPMSMFTYPHVKTVGQYLLTCHYSGDMPNDRSEEQDCYLKI